MSTAASTLNSVASTVAAIAWDPHIRGILAVAAGVIILIGSIYLLLGTNLAWRLGFLVAASALFGWIAILSFTFWMRPPGNGPAGRAPAWEVSDVVRDDLSQARLEEARQLDLSGLPDPENVTDLSEEELEAAGQQLGEWELIPAGGGDRAEAESAVEAALDSGEVTSPDLLEADTFITGHVLETGGEPAPESDSAWDRVTNKITNSLRITNPPHYAIVEVLPATMPEAEAGQPPPDPEPVQGAERVFVVLVRDLGTRRVPMALATIGSLAMVGLLITMLHKRDELALEHRAAPLPAKTGSSNGD
jgi:hypothetical protein